MTDSLTCAFCVGRQRCAFCGGAGYLPRFWTRAPLVEYQVSRCDVCGAIRVTTAMLEHQHICATCAGNLADATLSNVALDRTMAQ
jgi:hypothetical protein